MADDSELLERVRAAMSRVPEVHERKMFGSTAFLVRGKLCIAARADRLMCRIDPSLHDAALARAGGSAVVMRGRPLRGYLHVAADSVRTARALKYWIDLVLRHNRSLD